MSTGELVFLIFLFIGIILALASLLWFFFIKKHGNTLGESCTNDKDCASSLYCGGSGNSNEGTCVSGTRGKTEGSACNNNFECEFPLSCFNKVCATGPIGPTATTGPAGPTATTGSTGTAGVALTQFLLGNVGPVGSGNLLGMNGGNTGMFISSFRNKSIKVLDGNMDSLFLHVSTNSMIMSQWVPTFSDQVFSYNSMTNILTVKINGRPSQNVTITNAGTLMVTNDTPTPIFFIEMNGILFMVDAFNNPINTGINSLANLAVFVDRTRYPMNPVGIENNSIIVDIFLQHPQKYCCF